MVQIHARVGILEPPVGFDSSRPSKWGCWAKSHGTHNAPFFPARECNLPQLEKYRILDLLVVGNGGTVNACVFQRARFRGVFYFW